MGIKEREQRKSVEKKQTKNDTREQILEQIVCGSSSSPVLISACLLGVSCKYSGGDNRMEHLDELMERCRLITVCPEQLGGLATPRWPAEICGERVTAKDGTDVTAQYEKGAREALKLAQMFGCRCAILKARSPSCGSGEVYDGTFSKTLVAGDGRAAGLLKENGITVFSELEAERLLKARNNL